jgi:microcystin-dependent protein
MTWTAGNVLTAAQLNQQLRDNFNAAFPVGSIHYFLQAGTTVETAINGFALEMNGVAVNRSTYSSLNTLLSGLSYPFGSGDGTSTFNLPDAVGRALYHMAASGHADVNALGDSDGLTKTTRTPQHNSSNSLGVATHSHAAGLLAISPNPHTHGSPHTNFVTNGGLVASPGAGSGAEVGNNLDTATASTSLSVTGSTANSTPAITGAIGPGGTRPNDLSPWLVAGVFAVKF